MIAVFVPGALAGGLLVSLALVIGDLVRRVRGSTPATRAAQNAAAAAVAEIDDGSAGTARDGLRSRRSYAVIALVAWGLVALAVPGATWNFMNPGGYISDIGWIAAISMAGILLAVAIGATALRLAPRAAPWIVAVLGAGAAVRFALGPEEFPVAVVLVASSGATAAGIVVARRWSRAATDDVPAWTRPLLRVTPLGAAGATRSTS